MAQRWGSPKGRDAFGLRRRRSLLTYRKGYAALLGSLSRSKTVSGKCLMYSVTGPEGI